MLSYEKYLKIKDYYWVSSEPGKPASWNAWAFSPEKPSPVPNPRMDWRHPTFEEACRRQEVFEGNRKYYIERVRSGSFSSNGKRYVKS